MKGVRLLALAALLCAFTGMSLAADYNNTFRAEALYSIPTGDVTIDDVTLEAQESPGVDFSYERRVTDLIGLQFGAGWVDYDIEATQGDLQLDDFGSASAMPVYGNILFHPLARAGMIDWYIGPGLAWVNFDNIEINDESEDDEIPVDDDLTWTARTGVDIKFGDGQFGINIDVRYIHTAGGNAIKTTDAGGNFITRDFKVNPYDVGIGFVWNF